MKIKRICETCGNVFYPRPSQIKEGQGKFCSHKCNGIAHSKRIKRTCEVCSKEFFVPLCKTKNGRGKYCSGKCRGIARSKNQRGKNSSNWKGGGIKRKCLICKKEFLVPSSEIKKGRGKYCSQKCHGIAQSKYDIGERNPAWKGGGIIKNCLICDKEFTVIPARAEKGEGKYCSKKCMGIARSRIYVGANCPSWKGGKVARNCIVCGKEFTIRPAQIKKGFGKYCSRKCQGITKSKSNIGKNNPRWKGGKTARVCLICGKSFTAKTSVIKNGGGKFCSRGCSVKAIRHFAKPKMTKPEKIFQDICVKHNLPFTFTGAGGKWVGNANPDFSHKTRKVVCEIFGDYWHSPLRNTNIKYTMTTEGRREQLKKEGYKLIVFWEIDLMRSDAAAFVLSSLKGNGIKI